MTVVTKISMSPSRLQIPVAAMRVGAVDMMTNIHQDAVINAPKLTRALANSGRFNKLSDDSWSVSFGNSRVPYAYIRELYNSKNPHTIRYLGRAADKHTAKMETYMRNAAKRMGL